MSKLWALLFEYAQDVAEADCMHDQEYRDNLTYGEKHTQWLRDHLSPEAHRHWDDAFEMRDLAAAVEAEHLFQAALNIGLRLGSLQIER